MPDWKMVVSERLGLRNIHEEAVRELAAHLEESYENCRSRGLTEPNALAETLEELDDRAVLVKAIRRRNSGEDVMNYRTRSLWIPAVASLLGASLAMASLQFAGLRAQLVRTGPVEMTFYWPWLGILPLCGALGAYLSHRAGASILTRLIAALAPVLWLLAIFIIIEPIDFAVNGLGQLRYFANDITQWVVVPGLALLIGAAPFLREQKVLKAEA
ncbi:MAG: hypothetical protein WAM79_17725 [Candidatus Sulfotelmatobacter sp.]